MATNIESTLIARFFDGLSGSTVLSDAGGSVGDMFDWRELQALMMVLRSILQAPFSKTIPSVPLWGASSTNSLTGAGPSPYC